MHLPGCFIVNVARDVLCRGIHLVERREIVQVFVVERANHALNDLLQMHKIVEQSGGIEFLTCQRDAHAIVVPVLVFALALVSAQVMARGKSFVNADLIHAI